MVRAVAIAALTLSIGIAVSAGEAASREQIEFFEKSVRPLLVERCYECHSSRAKSLKGGLSLESRAGAMQGGDSGPAVAPGDVAESLLISAVRYESFEMPPKSRLPEEEIRTLEKWIELGAPWPDEPAPASTAKPVFDLEQRKRDHWVWQPVRSPAAPDVSDKTWPRGDIDRFILHRLEQQRLRPAPDVDRSALLRRLCFDLTGLPPTAEEAKEFLADESPLATERLVDRLLASPHFGERWGRHWLDLVRYAESRGHEFDNDAPNAFQYRDYVIRTLNADLPYDRFVREHIAGDLLDPPRLNPGRGFNESILGTGFWHLGEWTHSPVDIRKDECDRFDNMLDVMSKAFLGVTLACARCHDHKFDAISTADYYSLSGFLQGSDYRQAPFESLEHNRDVARRLAEVDAKYRAVMEQELTTLDVARPEKRLALSNAKCEHVLCDLGVVCAADFRQDGFLFTQRRFDEPYLETGKQGPVIRFASRSVAVSDPIWNGLVALPENGVNSRGELEKLPRGGRTLWTPTFELRHPQVACRVEGNGYVVACVDSHRMIAGPLHGETIQRIKPADRWVTLNLERYLGHRLHLEFTPAENASLEVSLITQGATPEDLARLDSLEQEDAEQVQLFEAAAQAALGGRLQQLAAEWSAERERLGAGIMRASHLAIAMFDGQGEDTELLIRGNPSNPGPVVPRRFLTAVSGDEPLAIPSGSGRRELAEQIVAPSNPLTYRVIVNRVWHHLLGRGIVPTTDDFGVLGQRPTHPELLDYLAARFVREGKSLKQLIREIVLSRTYQLSSEVDPAAAAVDPKNLLWQHRPLKRLEGEAIRDSLLSLSGMLDLTPFGEPAPIHLTPFMDGRGRPKESGPLDGAGRRSIYVAVRRNFLSPFLLAFDSPVPFSTMGRRNVSNVPAQALILMNDPFVVEQARGWAERVTSRGDSPTATIERMYLEAFARRPTGTERTVVLDYLAAEAGDRGLHEPDLDAWTGFAHSLINAKEFIYLR